MTSLQFTIRPEQAEDSDEIAILIEKVFGPAMLARAAYALREGVRHEMHLSFVAEMDGKLVGSVRLTAIDWGGKPALMLGPLGVLPQHKSRGIGRALMNAAVQASQATAKAAGPPVIMLVGDLDYYSAFGFERINPNTIQLPRPADPQRILACELIGGALAGFNGPATKRSNT